MAKLRGVLFDMDGTLVDTTYLHTVAWWQAFRRAGHDVAMHAIHRGVGMGSDKLLDHLLGEDRDTDQDEVLSQTHDGVFSTYWPALRSFDGARDLLRQCHDAGLTVVLASSAKDEELQALRAALDADFAVDASTSSSDAEESKPSPDILEAALKAAGLGSDEVLFVGDAVWDVKAAAKLGIPTVGLVCGGYSDAELLDAGAVEVHRSPRELLQDFAASAIGRGLTQGWPLGGAPAPRD
ncbi:HAD family hydrolase [Paenarthrobacter sp. DKR-5]|uniref:HAD family hydrolase n=1 Tax=Paenarthrobacter sp. DKR-5 TaxID=2835535 RepID=UPI001BDD9AFB|nr:HAD family hydrolase [Paenarthrobacter sp. DKR-5]MBT1001493.1 HAD family hydrolase [Paenarthrobacter sp. DKR-5]